MKLARIHVGSFTYPVTINISNTESKDGWVTLDFTAKFKRVAASEYSKMLDRFSVQELVNELLIGWSGLVYEGETVDYCAEEKTTLLEAPQAIAALLRSYGQGLHQEREKN